MTTLYGIPASAGFAMSRAFVYNDIKISDIPRFVVEAADAPAQWGRLEAAIDACAAKLQTQINKLSPDKDKVQFDILTVHVLMFHDPDFLHQVKKRLFERKENIEWAVLTVARNMVRKLQESKDAYLRERAVDISDISNSLIRRLRHIEDVSLSDLAEEAIVVTQDLLPSQALTMNRDFVKGLVIASGSYTSHTAILARAYGIPAVVGAAAAVKAIRPGDYISVDGSTGEVAINPDAEKKESVRQAMAHYARERQNLAQLRDLKAVTKDGKNILLKINIQAAEEVDALFEYGADGVGLFRSEFLFLTPGIPMEEERQTAIYSQAAKAAQGRGVVIRTSDVGGDKAESAFSSLEEKNPLLGWRAIRVSLAMPELFKTQLRAILRASIHGDIRIMFPMISGIGELERALALLEECK
ncbi:MAG: phosphoenolpyruvate--protein phosphotransferase, partial [Spirochaetaceae bacterium]|nr:phosphoenolpyruvate--protein phosphotransferase [Spirochaetaceae bacterium]